MLGHRSHADLRDDSGVAMRRGAVRLPKPALRGRPKIDRRYGDGVAPAGQPTPP